MLVDSCPKLALLRALNYTGQNIILSPDLTQLKNRIRIQALKKANLKKHRDPVRSGSATLIEWQSKLGYESGFTKRSGLEPSYSPKSINR